MREFTLNIAAGVIATYAAALLLTAAIVVLNRFTARAVDAQTRLLRRGWAGRLAVSALCNLGAYLLFAYLFAVVYKWFEWEMGNGPTYGVITAGISAPLINFIAFMFLDPKEWSRAALMGAMSLFCTYGYMASIVSLYQIVFKLMEGLPGL